MALKSVTLEVSGATYALVQSAAEVCCDAYDALKDGLQPVKDIKAVVDSVLAERDDLTAENFAEARAEFAANKVAFGYAVVCGLKDAVTRLVG